MDEFHCGGERVCFGHRGAINRRASQGQEGAYAFSAGGYQVTRQLGDQGDVGFHAFENPLIDQPHILIERD